MLENGTEIHHREHRERGESNPTRRPQEASQIREGLNLDEMKKLLKFITILALLLVAGHFALSYLGFLVAVSGGFLLIAISIVFVAVFSKAYRNWPI